MSFDYKLSKGPMQLGPPRFPGNQGSTGSPRGMRMPKLATSVVLGSLPGLDFVAISSTRDLVYGRSYVLWSCASGLGSLSRWLLTVPRGDGHATGRKQQQMHNWATWCAL